MAMAFLEIVVTDESGSIKTAPAPIARLLLVTSSFIAASTLPLILVTPVKAPAISISLMPARLRRAVHSITSSPLIVLMNPVPKDT